RFGKARFASVFHARGACSAKTRSGKFRYVSVPLAPWGRVLAPRSTRRGTLLRWLAPNRVRAPRGLPRGSRFSAGVGRLADDRAVNRRGDALQGSHQGGELFGGEGLLAVGEGGARAGVDLDDQAVGACGNRGAGDGGDVAGVAGAVAGVDDHRE